MAAKLTLFPARGTSRHFVLREGETRSIGRDPAGNALVLDDPRVSARHARIEWTGGGWSLSDLGSKNGTFIAGTPAAAAALCDQDWISVGGLLARFEIVSEEDLSALESERARRLKTSVEIQRDLAAVPEPRQLLQRLLGSVLSITGSERGFVLLIGEDGSLEAEVAAGFSDGALDERFDLSFGAIARVFETGESVVASDAANDAFLGKRPSVLELKIRTLACVPLSSDERRIGLIYVDGRKEGGVFTDLDLEILEALAANVSVVLSSVEIDDEIREMLGEPTRNEGEESRFFDLLERRVAEMTVGSRAGSSS